MLMGVASNGDKIVTDVLQRPVLYNRSNPWTFP